MAHEVISDTERQVVDAIGDFKSLTRQSDEVLMRFVTNLNNNFDELLDKEIIKDEAVFNFETLSLVQEEELDVMVLSPVARSCLPTPRGHGQRCGATAD